MIMPPYCEEDPHGPVSQAEALRLIKIMRERFAEEGSKHRKEQFKYKGGLPEALESRAWNAQQAMDWVYGLVKRVVVDPEQSRKALLKTAELLEREALNLRYRAKEIPSVADDK